MRLSPSLMIAAFLFMLSVMVTPAMTQNPVVSPDSTLIAVRQPGCTLSLRDKATGNEIARLYEPREFAGHPVPQATGCSYVSAVFSPDSTLLATQRAIEPIVQWAGRTGRKLGIFKQTSSLHSCWTPVFSRDSRMLMSVGTYATSKSTWRNRIYVWEVESRKVALSMVVDGKKRAFKKADLSSDGTILVVVEGPGGRLYSQGNILTSIIRLMDVRGNKELVSIKGHSAEFSQDERYVMIPDVELGPLVWDIRNKVLIEKSRIEPAAPNKTMKSNY